MLLRVVSQVGFISRFFGEKEPHGLLLEGIMRHLPRSRFHVVRAPFLSPAWLAWPSLVGQLALIGCGCGRWRW